MINLMQSKYVEYILLEVILLLIVNNKARFFFVHCPFQQLIPFVEDDSSKHEDRSAAQSRPATEERREILEVNKVLCSGSQ